MNTGKYLGIPYLEGGRTAAGCDCWGLVILWYQNELGITLPEYFYQCGVEQPEAIEKNVANLFEPVSSYLPNDILLFSATGTAIEHCGVYLGDRLFIHTTAASGVNIHRLGNIHVRAGYRYKIC